MIVNDHRRHPIWSSVRLESILVDDKLAIDHFCVKEDGPFFKKWSHKSHLSVFHAWALPCTADETTSKASWRSAKATMEAIRALQQQLMEVQQKGIFAANGNWPLLLELRLRYSKIGKHKFKSLYLELNYGIQIDPERTQIWKDMRYLVFSRYIQIICNHFLFFEFRSQPCQAQKASNVRKISERNCSWKWHFVEGTSLWFSGKWPHWKGEDF